MVELLKTFQAHSNYVLGLAITPDGKYLLMGAADKKIRIWKLT